MPGPRSWSWTTPPVDLDGAKGIHVNLADKASIDAAIDECGGPVHALFSCAGVDDGTPNIEKINFIGHRHLIERMIDDGTVGAGSAIAMISSAAGLGWEANLTRNMEYLATPDFDAAVAWVAENGGADYCPPNRPSAPMWPPGLPLPEEGHPHQRHRPRADRHTAGPGQPGAVARVRRRLPGRRRGRGLHSRWSRPTPSCSSAATRRAALNGITIVTDMGYFSAAVTEQWPDATPIVNFLLGRY